MLPPLQTPITLSIIMPVYNEEQTVAQVIDSLLELQIDGVTLELIIVESNSSDGTRSIVLGFEPHPLVTVVLQEHALGKGNAVRAGLAHATGNVVTIQDGDLEYKISDYPALIDPILKGSADFVLGSRYVAGEPMRKMPNARAVSAAVNAGHWVFMHLFNMTYRVHLQDPFTMFKMFRSECIEGVEFVANRFDFDWELVAKLIRLGYTPYEVPVSYESRSFDGGKKVRFFRDPPTWIAACIRFRIAKLPRQSQFEVRP